MTIIDALRLHECFELRNDGRLFWKQLPKKGAQFLGKEAGCMCHSGYWRVKILGRWYRRSRVVFAMVNGRWPISEIDHINQDRLDDRPINLREATSTQNKWNKGGNPNRELPTGVCLSRNKFQAQIQVNRRKLYLGLFATPDEAAAAYRRARAAHCGEFA